MTDDIMCYPWGCETDDIADKDSNSNASEPIICYEVLFGYYNLQYLWAKKTFNFMESLLREASDFEISLSI